MSTHNHLFTAFGLDSSMQAIFELLLEHPHLSITEIVQKTGLSRATISHAVKQLRHFGIVQEQRLGRLAHISLAHPRQLEQLIVRKQAEMDALKNEMETFIRQSTGTYNLLHHGPGVQFFEGRDAVQELLADSLKATGEILTITDHDAVERYAKQLNSDYVSARLKAGIPKRILIPNSKAARDYAADAQSDLTQIRLLDSSLKTHLATEIYNDSVSTIVATDVTLYGWLITQPIYAQFQKNLFEVLWKDADKLSR